LGKGPLILGVKCKDAKRVEGTKNESEGKWDAHMKEPKHIIDSKIDPKKKRNKRKGGRSFSNSE